MRLALCIPAAAMVVCTSQLVAQPTVKGWGAKVIKPDDAVFYLSGSFKSPTEADSVEYDLNAKVQQYLWEPGAAGSWRFHVGVAASAGVSTVDGASRNFLKGGLPIGIRYSLSFGTDANPIDFQLVADVAPTFEQDKDAKVRNVYLAPEIRITNFPGRFQTTLPIIVDTVSDSLTSRGRVGWTFTPRLGFAVGSNRRQDTTVLPFRREDDIRRVTWGVDANLDLSPIVQRAVYHLGQTWGRQWIGGGLLIKEQLSGVNASTLDGRHTFWTSTTSAYLLFTPTMGFEVAWESGRSPPLYARVSTLRIGLALLAP